MTTAERLREEGKIEGELKGKIEGKIEDARNMLSERIDLNVVLRVTGLTEKELKDHGVI
ncbi:hypothetical protein [Leptospira alstonii]|uniref:Transposase, YhgA-like domain protein n=1 Tax=Leptospira alstonii serovar Sichuan str. 79601 TaxID=1218565 RepID=M6CUQ8_9LEPT|nr:hypothetical protein [Leptospira alstonii]AGS80517.1 hypothetical protein LEP1GSC193_0745 [Leptospira phage vB_LalZ_80412-LE1]EMJ95444.1 hypothetical protein LEP1GSC194_3545 [Leptospira alstonii serovar Sichuan str. 79601]